MPLDIDRLEKPRIRGGKVIARCPVCAEAGADRRCEHLVIFDSGNGAYRCIADPEGAGGIHSKRIHDLVGLDDALGANFAAKKTQHSISRPITKRCGSLPMRVPPLRRLTTGETQAIAALRDWSFTAGLELLSQRGLLHYGEVADGGRRFPSWIAADSSRRNVQARRLDGLTWEGIGGAKAKSLPGSQASWPIGAADIGERPVVVLTEGMPDLCCTLLVAWFEGLRTEAIAPVAMTGATNTIHVDALPYFRGKRIRVIEHRDSAGIDSGKRWSTQLWQAGALSVDGFRFAGIANNRGQPAKDLADFATKLCEENPPCVQILADLV